MNILQLLGCGFLTLVVYLVLAEYKSSAGLFVVTVFGAIVMLQAADQLRQIIDTLLGLGMQANINTAYFTVMVKMIGIAWITEFLCQTCRDAGSNALAIKLEFAAKVSILLLIFPVVVELLHTVIQLL